MGKSEKKSKEKKHHRDKSHKKEKRSERRSHSNKERHEEGSQPLDSFSLLLTHGLLKHPDLLAELPQMLIAMDSGECINISAISNPERREFLLAVFAHPSMPAQLHPGSGWAKAEGCVCIRRAVLESLVKNGDVINPQDLSQSQARAARMAPVLQDLLKNIPELITELGQLLLMISNGEAVDLSGMDNKDVKKALSRCLREIGADQPEGGSKYEFCLPELDEDVVREALRCNAEVLTAMREYELSWAARRSGGAESSDRAAAAPTAPEEAPSAHSASSSSEQSDSDEGESDSSSTGPMPAGPGLKGPARPTAEQLVAASAAAIQFEEVSNADEAEEDAFMAPPAVGPLVSSAGAAPSAGTLLDALGAEGFDVSAPRPAVEAADGAAAPSNGGREEWMLTPGQNRPSGGIDQLFKSGKNKFEGGKEAKKAAAALKAEREALERLMEDPEEKRRTEAILAEYREKRGPSLMDAHLEKLGKKPKTVDTRLKSFDHDKEMGGHRKMNIKDVQGMVSQSKELDTRFDKASVQKNFL